MIHVAVGAQKQRIPQKENNVVVSTYYLLVDNIVTIFCFFLLSITID